jgi:putative methionine-R-sulfoxide reductase with GAF domain
MCGKGWKDRTTYIVPDIRVLGNDYIACDPRDQSELVLPVLLPGGSCWGVLDIDSYTPSAFDDHDAREVTLMLQTAELMTLAAPIRTIV